MANTDYLRCPIVAECGECEGFKAKLDSNIGSDCFSEQLNHLVKKLLNDLNLNRDSNGKKNIKDIKIAFDLYRMPMNLFQNFKTRENEITIDDMSVYTHGNILIDVYIKRKNTPFIDDNSEVYYKILLEEFWRNKGTSLVHMSYQIYNVSDDEFIRRDIKQCILGIYD